MGVSGHPTNLFRIIDKVKSSNSDITFAYEYRFSITLTLGYVSFADMNLKGPRVCLIGFMRKFSRL